MKKNTIVYAVRINGCEECPAAYIHDGGKSGDKCLKKEWKIGKYVETKTWPKWCPMLPLNKLAESYKEGKNKI